MLNLTKAQDYLLYYAIVGTLTSGTGTKSGTKKNEEKKRFVVKFVQ